MVQEFGGDEQSPPTEPPRRRVYSNCWDPLNWTRVSGAETAVVTRLPVCFHGVIIRRLNAGTLQLTVRDGVDASARVFHTYIWVAGDGYAPLMHVGARFQHGLRLEGTADLNEAVALWHYAD